MRKIKILLAALLVSIAFGVSAQTVKIKGKITGPDKAPVKGALISATGAKQPVQTNEAGEFEFETSRPDGAVTVEAEGFYNAEQALLKRNELNIVLIPEGKTKYNDEFVLPFRKGSNNTKTSSAINIAKKDLGRGLTIEDALRGQVSGLQVTAKSGMPTEGSYLNLRGIRSLEGTNSPLIVINGVPYLPDMEISPLIGGYSKSIFANYDINDIQNITVLKGADASIYGSLGSNGVILIETDGAASDDLDTRISFYGQYGMSWNNNRLPVLGVKDYKSYLNDIGTTYYDNMQDLFNRFPFLLDNPDHIQYDLYNNNTNWQKEIYKPSFVTDNVFRIEGGDAIAKYDISLGYMRENGILDKTYNDRYQTQINTNILISRKFEVFTTVGMSYMNAKLQEQGMIEETNPVLVAAKKMPVLHPHKKDADGNVLAEYDIYRYDMSNPVAIVKTLDAKNKQYDVNIRVGLNYKPMDNLTFSGIVGLYYNYATQDMFIPGVTHQSIIPLNYNIAENTVRAGVSEILNMYYNLGGNYTKTYNDVHKLNVLAGAQILTTRNEFDAGSGYNTANDFYQTLNHVDGASVRFFGYNNEWNWMNFYAHADYTYNNLVRGSLNMALDGSSSSGDNANRFGFFPSLGVTLMAKNLDFLADCSLFNRVDIRAEYGLTGNSRFSANYGKNYYRSAPFLQLSGIIRSNVPNTNLKWERTRQLNLGIDLSILNHRLDLGVDYYYDRTTDVLVNKTISSVYGSSVYYDNSAEIENKGLELSMRAALVQTKDFEWIVGGNIALPDSKVKSLGGVNENIMSFADGSELITRVGENPYSFYGYEADGVIRSQRQADEAELRDGAGRYFEAGDVLYKDIDGNNLINRDDKKIIGSAMPDYFGGFYTSIRYRNFSLGAEFTYSVGNDAYNAVRRDLESMKDFSNQSKSVLNRWQMDGQRTDVPRAVYGDPMDNNRFSSRWIEDASYLKLRNVTLSYSFNKTFLKFFRSGTLYVTGENLYTWTDYLGLDPEFSYSYSDAMQGFDYAKVVLPKTVKFGVNLKF